MSADEVRRASEELHDGLNGAPIAHLIDVVRADERAKIVERLREIARRAKGRAVPPPDWKTCEHLADLFENTR